MVFNSYSFVLMFMPIFLIGIYVKKGNAGKVCDLWIIACSLIFYAFFGINHLAVFLISIFWNICVAIPLKFMRSSSAHVNLFGKDIAPAKLWMAVGVSGNIILLMFFKLWKPIVSAFSGDTSGFFFPIAISFFTFNQISYIVDLAGGEIEEFSLRNYLSYILFFPKLIQGPLMGYTDFRKEMEKVYEFKAEYETILRGLLLFSIGLFKKVIIADTFSAAVDYGYDNILALGSLEAVLTALFYGFQIYFDFSGYCDMASAICMMIGFELPVNFNSPYKAENIVDFWKRWHITLSKFFTGYLYIPLGGNRKGKTRTYVNYMIVFLLSGIWHGTGITFIIWGAMHGVLYVVTKALGNIGAAAKSEVTDNNLQKIYGDKAVYVGKASKTCLKNTINAGILATFIYVNVAWIFFRAENVRDAICLIKQMFVGGLKPISTGLSSCFQLDELWYVIKITPIMNFNFAWDACLWLFVIAAVVMIFFCENALVRSRECKIGLSSTLLTAFLLVWSIVSLGDVSTFLYMNF